MDGRGGRQQCLGVGVQRPGVDLFLGAHFYRAAQVHHQYRVSHMPHHRQVVRDKHVGSVELLLQVHKQVEHLRLDRYVQRRGRFIRHQHFGLQHHGPGQGDTLALAAREHMRVALVMLGAQADLFHHGLDFFATFAGVQFGVDQ